MYATKDPHPATNQSSAVEAHGAADVNSVEESTPICTESDQVKAIAQDVGLTAESPVTPDSGYIMLLDHGDGTTMQYMPVAIPTADLHGNCSQAIKDSDNMEVEVGLQNQLCEVNRLDNSGDPTVGTQPRSAAAAATNREDEAHLMQEMNRLDDEFLAAYQAGSNVPIWVQETIPAMPTPSELVLELSTRNAALREQLQR
ncbi:hypothetical protein FN846DRAFT_904491 [Sphaerosporella brunnea]|uniref:Uncharacterized protein n=1 Tax=Sphaerosporella brunnea TaxID=1250544 RepID=A0A5J5F516_9PEZI|nr:hypothetical protein FN846DRAFT_904491 [Sphaerosporella brunnea]